MTNEQWTFLSAKLMALELIVISIAQSSTNKAQLKNAISEAVGADRILTHPADPILTQDGLLVFEPATVDKCTQ